MKKAAGFSLIELMVVVAIVGLLAMIGYPAYMDQVQQGRRGEMQGQLMSLATTLESYKARKFSYTGATLAALAPSLSTSNNYTVTLNVAADGRSYEILAAAKAQQVGDGALKLDSQNRTCHDPANDSDCDLTDPSLAWNH